MTDKVRYYRVVEDGIAWPEQIEQYPGLVEAEIASRIGGRPEDVTITRKPEASDKRYGLLLHVSIFCPRTLPGEHELEETRKALESENP